MSIVRAWLVARTRRGGLTLVEDWSPGDSLTFNFPKFKSRWSPRRPYNHADGLL